MKSNLLIGLFSSISLAAASASTVVISDLTELGATDETLTSFNTSLSSYNNRTVNGVTAVDTKDATFALNVDFASPSGAGTDNHVIWETGGGTIGMSLVYAVNTNTLSLRQVSNNGLTVLEVHRVLTALELAAGDLELVWTYDADGDSGSRPLIELYVDKVSAGTDASNDSQNDWSGTDAAGLGGRGGTGVSANGGNMNLSNPVNFTDGTINYTTGLRFWADTHVSIVPEPSAFMLFFAGLCMLLLRRRR